MSRFERARAEYDKLAPNSTPNVANREPPGAADDADMVCDVTNEEGGDGRESGEVWRMWLGGLGCGWGNIGD